MPVHYDFDAFIDRRHTESDKWNTYDPDVLPLWVADMDFVSPEPVIRALQERVAHGVFGYPRQVPGLKGAVIDRLANLYGWQVEPDELVFIPGVVRGFYLACCAFLTPEQSVLVQTPVYQPILRAARTTGVTRQEMELTQLKDGSYSIDWDRFEEALTDQTRLFILCNPHNPVGRVYRRDELERMAEICLRRGVTICSDEIHAELVFTGHRHVPIAALDPEIARNTITLIAPSKTFNVPGLHCSVAVVQNSALRKKYLRASRGLVGGVNLLGMVAALAAYREGDEWLGQVMVYLANNRDFLAEYVRHELKGVSMTSPQGTYLAWLDCRQAAAGVDQDPHKFFLEQARVGLNDGRDFGQGGQGFVRLNFGCRRATLEEALERMRQALNSL